MYSIWHIWFFRQIIKIQYWISAQISKVKESSLSSNPLGTIYSGRFFRDAVIIFHSVSLPREQQRRRSFINSYIILTIWPQLLAQFNTTRRASLHFNAYNNTTLCHHVAGCWLLVEGNTFWTLWRDRAIPQDHMQHDVMNVRLLSRNACATCVGFIERLLLLFVASLGLGRSNCWSLWSLICVFYVQYVRINAIVVAHARRFMRVLLFVVVTVGLLLAIMTQCNWWNSHLGICVIVKIRWCFIVIVMCASARMCVCDVLCGRSGSTAYKSHLCLLKPDRKPAHFQDEAARCVCVCVAFAYQSAASCVQCGKYIYTHTHTIMSVVGIWRLIFKISILWQCGKCTFEAHRFNGITNKMATPQIPNQVTEEICNKFWNRVERTKDFETI